MVIGINVVTGQFTAGLARDIESLNHKAHKENPGICHSHNRSGWQAIQAA
ncbi:hypothetical protein ACMYR3_02645 [Ampullimonas aquatilis]